MSSATFAEAVLATRNAGKIRELESLLAESLGPVRVLSAADAGLPDVVEDGITFEANALLKARFRCGALRTARIRRRFRSRGRCDARRPGDLLRAVVGCARQRRREQCSLSSHSWAT